LVEIKSGMTIPGDKLAVIEEFEAGEGTYVDDGVIRASTLGIVHKDLVNKKIMVKREKVNKLPEVGDLIIGQVELVQPPEVYVRIHFINDLQSQKGFIGMLLLRESESKGNKLACKAGDLVRAKVAANVDMIILLTLSCPRCGVIYAHCSLCGRQLVKTDARLKCAECGNVEYRLIAPDYGKVRLP